MSRTLIKRNGIRRIKIKSVYKDFINSKYKTFKGRNEIKIFLNALK
jgi:hypothetical protein